LLRSKDLVNWDKVTEIIKGRRNSSRSKWGWSNGSRDSLDNMVKDGGWGIVDNRNWKTKYWSSRNSIISLNRFSFSLFNAGSSSSSFSMGSKMFSSSSSNFRCFYWGNWSYKWGSSWCNWASKWGNSWSSWGNWDISSSNSESIDIIRDVVDSLENSIGINILVTSSGDTKSIL